jgi:hypothetical protein
MIWIGFLAKWRIWSARYFDGHTTWTCGVSAHGDCFDKIPDRVRSFGLR